MNRQLIKCLLGCALAAATALGHSPSRSAAQGMEHGDGAAPPPAATSIVREGESIQKAIDAAGPGGVVEVRPGVYNEGLKVDWPDFTLRGVKEGERRPILDGKNELRDAVIASGDNFVMTEFDIKDYRNNGIAVLGSNGLTLTHLFLDNTGVYGIFPEQTSNLLIEYCHVTRVKDAGIYVSQSDAGVVRGNYVYGNVAGIELENSSNILVETNLVEDNTGGVLAFALPNKVVKVGEGNWIVGNTVQNNNHVNFGDPLSIVGRLPSGAGITVMASDATKITDNDIIGNDSYGVAVVHLGTIEDPSKDPELDPDTDGTYVFENRFEENGGKPAGMIRMIAGKGADLLFSGRGEGNCASMPEGTKSMALGDPLPQCDPAKYQPMLEKNKGRRVAYVSPNVTMAPPAGKTVSIEEYAFNPRVIEIHAGETVVWTNKDKVAHTVTSGADGKMEAEPALNSGFISAGYSFHQTFGAPGDYVYFCQPHRNMESMRDARVIVR